MYKIFIVSILLGLMAVYIYGEEECQRCTYELTITPASSTGQYEMQIGEAVTFSAIGITHTQVIPEKVFWSFEYKYLEKISGSGAEIRLKAIKSGTTKLKAVGSINNRHLSKEISINITP